MRVALALGCLTLLFPPAGAAQTRLGFMNFRSPDAGYRGVTDVRISDGNRYAWNPTVNYSDRVTARVGGDAGAWNRTASCLLRFELAGIDAGTVTNTNLTLNLTNPSSDQVQVFPLQRAWDDSEATWLQASVGVLWQQGGARGAGDRFGQVLSFTPNTTGQTQYALPPSVVSDWLTGTVANNGLVLEAPAMSDAFEFVSDKATATLRPRLSFSVDGAPITLRDGLGGYAGTTLTCLGNGADPKLVSQDGSGLEVNGWPLGTPDPNRNRSTTLVRFDLTAIPTWAAVVDAELTFNGLFGKNGAPINAWALRSAWSESATWFTRDGTQAWLDAGVGIGADTFPAVLGTLPSSDGGSSNTLPLVSEDAVLQLQQWVAQPSTNFGFALQNHRLAAEMLGADESESASGPELVVRFFEGSLICDGFSCSTDAGVVCSVVVRVVAAEGGQVPPAGLPATTLVNAPFGGNVGLSAASLSPTVAVPVTTGGPVRVYWSGTTPEVQLNLSPEDGRWQGGECGPYATPNGAGGGSGGAGGAGGAGGGGGSGGQGGSGASTGGGGGAQPGDLRVGCGCGAGSGALGFAALALLLAARRRRR
jgi:hypothetical protein